MDKNTNSVSDLFFDKEELLHIIKKIDRKKMALLRKIFVSGVGGMSFLDSDMSPLDLVSLGLIEFNPVPRGSRYNFVVTKKGISVLDEDNKSYYKITSKGVRGLKIKNEIDVESRSHHDELAELACHFYGEKGYAGWCNVSMDCNVGEGLVKVVRPDVLLIKKTYNKEKIDPIVIEVKVSRSDFLSDISNHDKRNAYRTISSKLYYLAPKGIIDREKDLLGSDSDIGIIEYSDESGIDVVRVAKKRKSSLSEKQILSLLIKTHSMITSSQED